MKKLIFIFFPLFTFSQGQDDVFRYIDEFKKNPKILYTDLSREYIYDGHTLVLPRISDKQYDLLYEYIVSSEISDWHISWRGVNLYFNGHCILGDCIWGKRVYFNEDLLIKSAFKDSIDRNLVEIYSKRSENYKHIINDRFLIEGSTPPKYFEDKSYKYLIDYNYQKQEYKLGVWHLEDNFLENPIKICFNGKYKSDGQLGAFSINFYDIDIFSSNTIIFMSFYDGSSMGFEVPYFLSVWQEDFKNIDFSFIPSDARVTKLIRVLNYFKK